MELDGIIQRCKDAQAQAGDVGAWVYLKARRRTTVSESRGVHAMWTRGPQGEIASILDQDWMTVRYHADDVIAALTTLATEQAHVSHQMAQADDVLSR